jgi:uncharacterized membrane protein YphA (DoxX/SURF4 family)
MEKQGKLKAPGSLQTAILFLMRIAIGWHFLYEGLGKLLSQDWTSRDYLAASNWFLADVYHWISDLPELLPVVDAFNIWGQILIGVCLMLGLFTRLACLAGALLLALYYMAYVPLAVVNSQLIELIALGVLAAVPFSNRLGLDRLLALRRRAKRRPAESEQEIAGDIDGRAPGQPLTDRRELIKSLAGLPFVAAMGTVVTARNIRFSNEERQLVDAFTGATRKAFSFQSLQELKGRVPMGKICGRDISRIILGGNIVCGFAHARDLIYVSELVLAYHTPAKIFETFMLAEKCGINTILTHPSIALAINYYWKQYGGKIQFLADCGWMEGKDTLGAIDYAVDNGASLCYLQGEIVDDLVAEGGWDLLNKCLERVRHHGLPVGIGAHRIETLMAVAEKGIVPDFWMKTLHPQTYWSAKHPEWHDNKYCFNSDATIEFMRSREEPWIAFKTMAAGAVHPKEAFHYAFENGADFICAGMYDFQMVEDANIAIDILSAGQMTRQRPWMA